MSGGRVVVVGSLHYDVMVEAADRPRRGETLMGRAWWPKCGGKGGNQAVEAALAGARTAMVGAVGDDAFGADLIANLDRAGVDRSAVAVVPGGSSGMSVAIIDAGGDYGAVVVSGVNRSVDPSRLALAPGDVVVLQNEVPDPANLAAARAAAAAGARVVLNAAPARPLPDDLASLVDVLVVNAIEAEMMGAPAVHDGETAGRAATALTGLCRSVIVTAGPHGAAHASRAGETTLHPAPPVTVRSTHGAGDCFVGVLAARLAAGETMPVALDTAIAAASALVAMAEPDRVGRRPPGS
jgi:ribokinase